MPRKIDVEDIVGGADIAEMFGISNVAVVHFSRRYPGEFPEPVRVINRGKTRLWDRVEIEAWGRLTRRLPLEDGRVYDSKGFDVTDRRRAS